MQVVCGGGGFSERANGEVFLEDGMPRASVERGAPGANRGGTRVFEHVYRL